MRRRRSRVQSFFGAVVLALGLHAAVARAAESKGAAAFEGKLVPLPPAIGQHRLAKTMATKKSSTKKAAAKKPARKAPVKPRSAAPATKGKRAPLRIATFNVNGLRSRLSNLLEWLAKEAPDVVCLQELKTADAAFPSAELRAAGYGALWHGQVSWNGVAILTKGAAPIEIQRGLPGDAKDTQSRYLEAAAHGVHVACLYLPNGNPQPGPKFAYKLAWFERLIAHATTLFESEHPVLLAGDFNVVPTDFDIYNTRSWLKDALLQPESRECFQRLLAQGWLDALRSRFPDERIYTFWDYFRQHWQTNSGLRIDHLLLNPALAPRLVGSGVDTWVRGREHASDHAPTWITIEPD